MRKPSVFLFDEATSALDRQNEKEIQETIDQVCSTVTSVSIAHRLQTIKNSDQIIVLVEGKISESGNHEHLMEIEDGVYKGLYLKQDKGNFEGGEEGEHKEFNKFEHNEEMNEDFDSRKKSQRKISEKESVHSLQNSQPEIEIEEKKTEEEKKKQVNILGVSDYLSGSEICQIILGVISSGAVGVVMPFSGYYFGKILGVYGQYDYINKDPTKDIGNIREELWDKGMEFFYVMGGIAIGSFLFAFLQFQFFGKVSNHFVVKIRKLLFRKFIYKDIEYFDQPENKPGNLSAKLAEDCNLIKTLVGSYLGSILQSLGSFILGLVFGFYYSWRITLLVIGLSPLLMLSGIMESIMFYGGSASSKVKEDENLVQESFNNIKVNYMLFNKR